jgi:hypothetical protein
LRIDDAAHVGGAIAAIGKGYRGQKVDIPEADMPGVKKKIRAAWKKFHPDLADADMPEVIANMSPQAGSPAAQPSEDIDPQSACDILHTGTVHGKPLTDDQRKLFGAACKPTGNENMALTPERRQQLLANLTANCSCGNGALGNLPDETLQQLERATAIANEATKGFSNGKSAYRVNPDTGKWERRKLADNASKADMMDEEDPEDMMDQGADEDEEDAEGNKKKKVKNVATQNKQMTMADWLSMIPDEAKPVWNSLVKMSNHERERLVGLLVANVHDEIRRAAKIARYSKMDLDDLREIVEDLQPTRGQPADLIMPNYMGAAGGGFLTANVETDLEPLNLPQLDDVK